MRHFCSAGEEFGGIAERGESVEVGLLEKNISEECELEPYVNGDNYFDTS